MIENFKLKNKNHLKRYKQEFAPKFSGLLHLYETSFRFLRVLLIPEQSEWSLSGRSASLLGGLRYWESGDSSYFSNRL